MSLYKQIILEHAQNPKNFGKLKYPDSKAHVANPLCGDEITIEIKKYGNILGDVKFSGTGCIIMKASASLLTEKVKKLKNINRIKDLNEKDALNLFGGELTPTRQKCAILALSAIKKALEP